MGQDLVEGHVVCFLFLVFEIIWYLLLVCIHLAYAT